jgi:hypothetical protein
MVCSRCAPECSWSTPEPCGDSKRITSPGWDPKGSGVLLSPQGPLRVKIWQEITTPSACGPICRRISEPTSNLPTNPVSSAPPAVVYNSEEAEPTAETFKFLLGPCLDLSKPEYLIHNHTKLEVRLSAKLLKAALGDVSKWLRGARRFKDRLLYHCIRSYQFKFVKAHFALPIQRFFYFTIIHSPPIFDSISFLNSVVELADLNKRIPQGPRVQTWIISHEQ